MKIHIKIQEVKINIFYIETDPYKAAQSMVDRNVVKMILETAQLLSTAHRILDGTEYIGKSVSGQKNVRRWLLSDELETKLYSATHVNHPSAVWVRQSLNNYNWLYCHFEGLLNEYTRRYGKVHKCNGMKEFLIKPPKNIPTGYFTSPTCAMPDEYKISKDAVENYRYYYNVAKKHLHSWKNAPTPDWIIQDI
jgi:hypothetical protein